MIVSDSFDHTKADMLDSCLSCGCIIYLAQYIYGKLYSKYLIEFFAGDLRHFLRAFSPINMTASSIPTRPFMAALMTRALDCSLITDARYGARKHAMTARHVTAMSAIMAATITLGLTTCGIRVVLRQAKRPPVPMGTRPAINQPGLERLATVTSYYRQQVAIRALDLAKLSCNIVHEPGKIGEKISRPASREGQFFASDRIYHGSFFLHSRNSCASFLARADRLCRKQAERTAEVPGGLS